MRRRQAGLAHAQQKDRIGRDFQQIGDTLAAKEIEQLQQQLETFKQNLEEFAWKHQKDIKKDPLFRSHFQRMCANIGVDPLASNKGFWADMLGVGDFYYELGIQIIEACMQTRSRDGGLTALEDLMKRLDRMRGKEGRKHQVIIEDDIIRAIKTLKPLNGGFEVIALGTKKMVRSVPTALDKDQAGLLLLAQKLGYVNRPYIRQALGWDDARIDNGLDRLLQDGLVWVDDQAEDKDYWVPSYFDMMD
ncbi:EAP30/Vps36 family-domain-containing protein [Chlamydoabsidia padenii]|nr:EAP30/Vps36 family-domain-containing protein [Chlamydoabsidia padenii]